MYSLRRISPRAFTRQLRMYSSDDASSRPYRQTSGDDSFARREHANEDMYIREHEKEQLRKLQAQIKDHEKSIQDLQEKASKLEN